MAEKWYFKTTSLIILFISIGPFALPFLWLNPHISHRKKINITIIIAIISIILGIQVANSLRSIIRYYDIIINRPLN
ncbi:MAG: hypothetical protein FJZ08_02685 [Candidatus Omnitrophica bacterium]|nr:hypothetical protein [Candidatus Omnitrophota bacterium]